MAGTRVFNFSAAELHVYTGEADIDVSASDYTGYITLLTVAPANGHACKDMRVKFDLSKATTGFSAVNTSETIIFAVASAIDGTNYRIAKNTETPSTALSGTNAANTGAVDILIGDVGYGQPVRIYVKLSAETGGDCELPFVLTYESGAPATVTAVAN